jgi:hypothetical protein
LLAVNEFEWTFAFHLNVSRVGLRNLMELVSAEALSCFEVGSIAEGVLIPRFFSQGNVGLHHPSKDTFTKMLFLDGHTPNVHYQTLLTQDWLYFLICFGDKLLL